MKNTKTPKKSYLKHYLSGFKFLNWANYLFYVCLIYEKIYYILVAQVTAGIIWAVEAWDTQQLYFLVKVFVILTISLIIIWKFLTRFIEVRSNNWLSFRQRDYYFRKYFFMDNSEVEKIGIGKISNIMNEGIGAFNYIYTDSWINIFTAIISFIYSCVLILLKAPTIYYIVWVIMISVLCCFFFYKSIKTTHKARKQQKERNMENSRQRIKMQMSKIEILQQNKIQSEIDILKSFNDKSTKLWTKTNFIVNIWSTLVEILFDGWQVVIYVLVGAMVMQWDFEMARFLLLLNLLNICNKNLNQISNNIRWVYNRSIDIEKLRDFVDETPTYDYNAGSDFHYKIWKIEIKKLTFDYENRPVFKDFDLKITWWNKTAFVGESWGWKSTLLKLLAGYLRPQSGSIKIDWQDLSEVKLIDYFKHIWYLTQDPSVFDWTVYDNLVYALDYEPSEEELKKVIEQSNCQFVRDYKTGLQTEIWERGVRLSGGQKQRLAIAKIMLKNPNIILLDEPTSALDSVNEEQISEALHHLFKWKTVLIVAHRLQTVKSADRILLIENWKIVEDGTHSELVHLKWKYKRMLDLQAGF